jgi:hypothetical protein
MHLKLTLDIIYTINKKINVVAKKETFYLIASIKKGENSLGSENKKGNDFYC